MFFAALLFALQLMVLGLFCFFAAFNYLYAFASLRRPRIRRACPSQRTIAVVIVAYNEREILPATIASCERLSYPNKLIVLVDDSDDPGAIAEVRALAMARGCRRADRELWQSLPGDDGKPVAVPVEVFESPGFVCLHRARNVGFKGGALRAAHDYLEARGIELMYLLDADWQPQQDALERTLEVLEADPRIAFVQTARFTAPAHLGLFQRYAAINEEGCYYVDFRGRQVLRHPILFSGCCTLLRSDVIRALGGFAAGHLTEDLDLSNRMWEAGWEGVYLQDVINYGDIPYCYHDFRRQQKRWATGTARSLREHFRALIKTPALTWPQKLAALRQNAYYTAGALTTACFGLAAFTVFWLTWCPETFAAQYYLYLTGRWRTLLSLLTYACVCSNFCEPMIACFVRKKYWPDAVHGIMSVWYSWSTVLTYAAGTFKGLFGGGGPWFRTPKFVRGKAIRSNRLPMRVRCVNLAVALALAVVYYLEGWAWGWLDPFALVWLPAFLLAAGAGTGEARGPKRTSSR